MRIWLRLAAVLALATIFVFSALHFRRPPDPVVHGRAASQWAADLLHPDYAVRGEAQNALRELGEAAVPQLCVLLRQRNPLWEETLARLNARFRILKYQRVDSVACRRAAAEMLAVLGPGGTGAIPDLIKALALDAGATEVERALVRIGDDSISHLSLALEDARNATVRKRSAAILRQFESLPARAIAALMAATRDRTAAVREEAALSLGARSRKDPPAEAALVPLTQDPAANVRAAAFKALGEMGIATPPVFAALELGLADESVSVRLEAAKNTWTLKRDSAAAVPVLIQILAGFEHRWEAAYALGEIGPAAEAAIPQLIKVLAQEQISRPFRTPPSSAFALGKIGPAAIPALSQLLENPDARLRTSVLLAFGFMGAAGNEAVSLVTKLLQDKDPEVRHIAALTLPAIGARHERVVAGLADCLSDEDIYIRSAAAAVLRDIAPEKDWVVQPE